MEFVYNTIIYNTEGGALSFKDVLSMDLDSETKVRVLLSDDFWEPGQLLMLAANIVEANLFLFEGSYPGDSSPRNAVLLAKKRGSLLRKGKDLDDYRELCEVHEKVIGAITQASIFDKNKTAAAIASAAGSLCLLNNESLIARLAIRGVLIAQRGDQVYYDEPLPWGTMVGIIVNARSNQ